MKVEKNLFKNKNLKFLHKIRYSVLKTLHYARENRWDA
jgi:hypothetical protein